VDSRDSGEVDLATTTKTPKQTLEAKNFITRHYFIISDRRSNQNVRTGSLGTQNLKRRPYGDSLALSTVALLPRERHRRRNLGPDCLVDNNCNSLVDNNCNSVLGVLVFKCGACTFENTMTSVLRSQFPVSNIRKVVNMMFTMRIGILALLSASCSAFSVQHMLTSKSFAYRRYVANLCPRVVALSTFWVNQT
jgi:hypothetical protein